MTKTCLHCEWFVEETETIGDYQHSEAVKKKRGFCLIQDLFTMVEPNDGCDDWREEDK